MENRGNANVKEAIPFFGVTDMQRSLKFYIDGLGFVMKLHWTPEGKLRWCMLQKDGARIMLQEFWKEGHLTGVPVEKLGAGVSVCFICEDALVLYHEFTRNGCSSSEPFVGNGMWVTELDDPDGYKLCFESYTDVPEETRYSDWIQRKK
jgi:lactoylglutathione lyase